MGRYMTGFMEIVMGVLLSENIDLIQIEHVVDMTQSPFAVILVENT